MRNNELQPHIQQFIGNTQTVSCAWLLLMLRGHPTLTRHEALVHAETTLHPELQ